MFTSKKIRMRAAKAVIKIEEFFYCNEEIDMDRFNAFLRGQNKYLRELRDCSKIERFGLGLTGTAIAKACKDPNKIIEYARKAVGNHHYDFEELLGYLDEMLKDVA